MKKTILASAIAAASFSGAAFAQENLSASELAAKMDSMPSVYGNIQYAITHSDVDGGPSDVEHRDNGSTIGLTHDHEIMPGLSAFFKAELEFDGDDKAGNGGLDQFDEAYIGVNSDSFGKVWIGSDDSTYERAIDEIANYYEAADLSIGGSYDTGEGDLVQYATPSFGGFQLHAAVQFNGDGEELTEQYIGLDDNNNEPVLKERTIKGEKSYPYQLAATYTVDALELAVAMDSNDGDSGYSSNDASANNENTYGLRTSYTIGDLRLTGQFQTRDEVGDVWGAFASYSIGQNQFALSYELAQYDKDNAEPHLANNDESTVTLQAKRNLSDNMYIFAEGYFGGGDNVYDTETVDTNDDTVYSDEKTVAAVGAVYYF